MSFLCFCFGVCNGFINATVMFRIMRAAGRNSVAVTCFLGAMQLLFGGLARNAIIEFGGADHSSLTATGLALMAL